MNDRKMGALPIFQNSRPPKVRRVADSSRGWIQRTIHAMKQPGKIERCGTFGSQPKRAGQVTVGTVAPPIYKPQPTPKVLQTRMAGGNARSPQFRVNSLRPTVPHIAHLRSQWVANPQNVVSPKLIDGVPSETPVASRRVAQRFSSRVVQATKFYPNLHPGAVESVDAHNIFRLNR